MLKFDYQKMLEAFRNNDSSYDGQFWVAVKSTGIYCLPSCKAKLPLEKNVLFLVTREEAIKRGFRGCKRCRSAFFPNVLPQWLYKIVDFMKATNSSRIKEEELVKIAQVDITTIRREFKNHFKITPIQYHRKLRLQYARKLIENGRDYLSVSFESGYESASGFRDAFIKEFDITPGRCYGRNKSHI